MKNKQKLTPEQFDKLSEEEQDKYLEEISNE